MSPSPNPRYTGTPITSPHNEGDSAQEVLRLFPEPSVRLAAEDVYSNISFPKREARPYVVINMVSSLDGKVTAGGKAGFIGGVADRLLMRSLRSCADAVMVGAGTLRAEKLSLDVPESLVRARKNRGLTAQPLAVVVTVSGNDIPIKTNLLRFSPDNLLILASSETTAERLSVLSNIASVEVVPEEKMDAGSQLDLTQALAVLKKRHAVEMLLVEGGPNLNHALIASGMADELFLTLAPKLLGGAQTDTLTILEGRPLLLTESANLEPKLISVLLSEDELFLRYTLQPR